VTSPLRVHWVSCTSSSSSAELREQCKRLCQVEVCAARNAVTAIERSKPSVVVFEFENPDASELQLLQTVKRLHPSVPILMITSAHNEDLAVWAFRARVWNYLVTPVPLRELKSNLQQLAKISLRRDNVTRRIERPGTMLPLRGIQAHGHTEQAAMQRIIEHVRSDHTSRLRVTKLARECGMSRFSFSRLFRSSFGCSCREYVMRLRIETACKMLEAPHPSVTHVAIAAGFTDASYFARMFRKRMRKSPIEYARAASRLRPDGDTGRRTKSAQRS
jgi:YesN/AraC family two-component response regulator